MPKAVFFNIPSSGHVNPTLPVMELLSQADIEIVYVNQAMHREKVEQTGVRFIAYPEMEIFETFFANPPTDNFPRTALVFLQLCRELMPFTLNIIEQEQPDFIIYDSLAAWGKMAGRVTELPTVAFITTFILDMKSLPPMPFATQFMLMLQGIRNLPGYASNMARTGIQYRAIPITFLDALMATGDTNIVFTSKAFQPDGEKYQKIAEFVGASIGKRADGGVFPFDALRDDVPKIYISMGTIARNDEFLRRCFIAFGEMDAQFIMSAGKQTDIAALGQIPENFIVQNFVPQLDVLERVDAFITHGGLNSVHESLLAGVPLITVPQQPEQGMVASQVVATGVGVGLQITPPYGDVSVGELRTALNQVLNTPAYKNRAIEIGDSLREAGGAPRVVELLQAFAKKIDRSS